MTDRVIAALLLVAVVYGGVYAVLSHSTFAPFFAFAVPIAFWCAHVVWESKAAETR